MADEMHNEENSCFEWLRETFKVLLLLFSLFSLNIII